MNLLLLWDNTPKELCIWLEIFELTQGPAGSQLGVQFFPILCANHLGLSSPNLLLFPEVWFPYFPGCCLFCSHKQALRPRSPRCPSTPILCVGAKGDSPTEVEFIWAFLEEGLQSRHMPTSSVNNSSSNKVQIVHRLSSSLANDCMNTWTRGLGTTSPFQPPVSLKGFIWLQQDYLEPRLQPRVEEFNQEIFFYVLTPKWDFWLFLGFDWMIFCLCESVRFNYFLIHFITLLISLERLWLW